MRKQLNAGCEGANLLAPRCAVRPGLKISRVAGATWRWHPGRVEALGRAGKQGVYYRKRGAGLLEWWRIDRGCGGLHKVRPKPGETRVGHRFWTESAAPSQQPTVVGWQRAAWAGPECRQRGGAGLRWPDKIIIFVEALRRPSLICLSVRPTQFQLIAPGITARAGCGGETRDG